jgi:hypothetical protein
MKPFATFTCGMICAILLMLGLSVCAPLIKTSDVEESTRCVDCEKDNFLEVPLDHFMENVARYNGTHVKDTEPEMRRITRQKLASRTCTYSIDTLKKFICILEKYAGKHGIVSKDLAIKFFYGVYDQKQKVNGEFYGSQHTLYMVPAVYDNSQGVYHEFSAKPLTTGVDSGYKPQDTSRSYLTLRDIAPLAMENPSVKVFMLDATSFDAPTRQAIRSTTSSASAATPGITPTYVWNQGLLCPNNCPVEYTIMNYIDDHYGRLNY